jgi:hypothetical protein
LKADLSDFISVEMSLLRVFKHRLFSLMFENSGAKSASASLLLTLLFFKMDKVEFMRGIYENDDICKLNFSSLGVCRLSERGDAGRNQN